MKDEVSDAPVPAAVVEPEVMPVVPEAAEVVVAGDLVEDRIDEPPEVQVEAESSVPARPARARKLPGRLADYRL